MFQTLITFLREFPKNLRFLDIIDILIVTLFLYIFINWFRKSATRRLIIAAIAFVSVYLLSRILGLYLTEMLINILAIFIALAFIIIFQSDLRRMIEMLGTLSIKKWRRKQETSFKIEDMLIEAVIKMAERRTGAIIAVKGKEPWDQVITGGIPLNGAPSLPLIYSIFSTSSPGHDGAVLVEGNRITRFGAHLPLSKNLNAIGVGGTRHAAALGMSEQCDALVIVVSEERGTIKIAQDGSFLNISSAAQIKEALDIFWNKNFQHKKETISGYLEKGKVITGAASFLLAFILWGIFAYQSDSIFRNYTVPLEFRNLKPDLILEEPLPADCKVTFSGSEQAFRLLNANELVASIDAGDFQRGENDVLIASDNFRLPAGLKLYSAEPRSIKVLTSGLKYIKASVRVQTEGRLPDNLKLQDIRPEPAEVTLRVPENENMESRPVLTETVNLSLIKTSGIIYQRLLPPRHARLLPEQNPEIPIRIKVSKK